MFSVLPLSFMVAANAASSGAAPPLAASPTLMAPAETYAAESLSGGPPKDGIPSIDDPVFEPASKAEERLADDDRVIGVHHNGEARAYPQGILVWHEIVNDTVGGKPVSVTYCPLTGTALGFERGETAFGVSGRLVNSNLIMYDRATDTWWPQVLGAGVRGRHTGEGLSEVRVVWTTWARWSERYPDTAVLTTETGHARNYRRDPYGSYNPPEGYYRPESDPIFPRMNDDDHYPPKHEIFGFRDQGVAVAVDREALAEHGVLRHEADGRHYLVIHDPGLDTGWVYRDDKPIRLGDDAPAFDRDGPRFPGESELDRINAFEAMWFAWAAFYPGTVVIDGSE